MKNVLNKIILLLSAITLALGVLLLFFGGTWDGVRIGLEILGAIWLLQTSYSIFVESRKEDEEKQELKKITDKYFRND